MIIDTHSHLNTSAFNKDLDSTIKRARANDVTKIIVIGMEYNSNLKAIKIANDHDGVYATVGVHPSDFKDDVLKIEPLLSNLKVVGIGECGIDLYHRTDNLEVQQKNFIFQIKLAIKHDLPLVIHTRNSFKEAYECLKPYKGQVRGVFHCFSSSISDALKAIDLGLYIGVGGAVTFPKAVELHEVVKKVPIDKLLVETDSPYIAPSPFRGSRNEPSYTKYVVKEIAKIRNTSVAEVSRKTTENAILLFGLEE